MNNPIQLDSIQDAIADIKAGKIIIVVDDAQRENEGDFVAAASAITPEMVNFMATHGRGLICTPLTEERCREIQLDRMVVNNTDPMETAFTVSVDLKGHGVTTGISAIDRAKTIQALIDPKTQAHELSRPGHIFPLIAKNGGVLRRTGHTEAAIDFARLAGFPPAGVIVEIMNEDGTMARLPQLVEVAQKFDLKLVSIEDLIAYRLQHDSLIVRKIDTEIQTRFGKYRLRAYQQTTNQEVHLALSIGTWEPEEEVLTRIQSTRYDNDLLTALAADQETALEPVFKRINKEEKGVIIFINRKQTPDNLLARIQALDALQKEGEFNTVPPMAMDDRDFGIGAQILHDLNVKNLRVLTNSDIKNRVGLQGYGLNIVSNEAY